VLNDDDYAVGVARVTCTHARMRAREQDQPCADQLSDLHLILLTLAVLTLQTPRAPPYTRRLWKEGDHVTL